MAQEWADFGEDLRLLVDKANPDFEDDAKEHLALNQFVSQLDNQQINCSSIIL